MKIADWFSMEHHIKFWYEFMFFDSDRKLYKGVKPRGRSLVIIIRNLRGHWAAISHESNLENACLLAEINHDSECLSPWCLHQALLIQIMSTFFDVLQYFSNAFNLGM